MEHEHLTSDDGLMIKSNGYQLAESDDRLGMLSPVPAGDRDDREKLWDRLRKDGYLYLKGFLPSDDVTGFREYYFSTMSAAGLGSTEHSPRDGIDGGGSLDLGTMRSLLFNTIVPSSTYGAITGHPMIVSWFRWFLGDDVHLHKRKIIRHVRPGESGIGTATQAHYDLVYLREGTDRVLSMWIPLGDCPVSMGGLTYLEGSHIRVLRDEASGQLRRPAASITADLPGLADQYDSRWLVADYEAGDVMVHSAHIIHAGTDNVDENSRIRLSTDIRYQRLSEPIDWRWQNHWRDDDGL